MQLPYHDRYPYSAIVERGNYDWPGGKRLAVYIGLNIEHFAFGAGRGHHLGTELPQPDARGFAWRDYGNRVGVWRLFDLFDELELPAAHLLNTALFDYAPQIAERVMARGDEIIGHGRTNAEAQGHLWPDDEKRLLNEVREAIKRHTGQDVRGWMGPWMSQSHQTPELLVETGYKFVMDWPADDQPLWMRTGQGPLMSVPYPLEINDSPQMLVRRHTPQDFEHMIIEQFEEMLEQSTRQPLVFGIALHTMIVGQPYRLRSLRRALKYIARHPQRDRLWFTRPGEIYDHCAALPPAILPQP
ncbi:polysaccharide deacetylase family protein [Achromobacter sp. DH1f]|uniref:polysaccharide deacetylase family protein n=1 Tax=Achromobacter sp. DH1f TaxID=1397275 RepID=UPI000467F593|nr:polysaccharide deacetylase family protein [Achromobacter sp. DH1f]